MVQSFKKTLAVGIAGTAKNTGKTTTMSAIMDHIKEAPGLVLGLTSIGYDGEGFDNVTSLPKPRINVWPGCILAVAEQCVQSCNAQLAELRRTDISTALGNVVLYRVIGPGKVVLAGPNSRRDLRIVLEMLRESASLIIIDGAFSRITPMAEADCLIIANGAARNTDIPQLASESRSLANILSTPALTEFGAVGSVGSIFTLSGFQELMKICENSDTINIQGVMSHRYLNELAAASGKLKGKRFIFTDPTKLLLAGNVMQVWNALMKLSDDSVEIGVAEICKLLAMTVNPYYPKYRYNKSDYQAAFVDSGELLSRVSESVCVPCFDVVCQSGKGICELIMSCGS